MQHQKRCLYCLMALIIVCTWPVAHTHAQTAPTQAEGDAYTGLHAAAHKADRARLVELLAQRPDLEMRDSKGRTALHVAVHGGHLVIVEALAKAGADIHALDSQRYDALTIAAVRDDLAVLRSLLAQGANAKAITSPFDGTALIAAAHLGHDGVVDALIAAGAPLDHVNNLGWTAAIEAVALGDGGKRHQATLRALKDAGANMRIADRNGATPLDLARARGYRAMVDILTAR